MEEQEFEAEVIIQETPGGFWNIWTDGCKIDDGHFRRAADAQEYCNANGWVVNDIRKHEQNQQKTGFVTKPRDGFYYKPPEQ